MLFWQFMFYINKMTNGYCLKKCDDRSGLSNLNARNILRITSQYNVSLLSQHPVFQTDECGLVSLYATINEYSVTYCGRQHYVKVVYLSNDGITGVVNDIEYVLTKCSNGIYDMELDTECDKVVDECSDILNYVINDLFN